MPCWFCSWGSPRPLAFCHSALPFPLCLLYGFLKAHAKPSISMKSWFFSLFQSSEWHSLSSLTARLFLAILPHVPNDSSLQSEKSAYVMWCNVRRLQKDATVLRSLPKFAFHYCTTFCLYISFDWMIKATPTRGVRSQLLSATNKARNAFPPMAGARPSKTCRQSWFDEWKR